MGYKTGAKLEEMIRYSVQKVKSEGLNLIQTGPRFVGSIGDGGQAIGRIVSLGALDFIGDYRGSFVTFDAKSTESKTSFKLDLIKMHQAVIVKRAYERGALGFFLVEFSKLEPCRYYALTWPVLKPYWDRQDFGGPMSIPLKVIQEQCLEIVRDRKTLHLVEAIEVLIRKAA